MPTVDIVKRFRFQAAHRLPATPPEHKCHRLHGHSYVVEVRIRGEVDPRLGWLVDFADVEAAWEPLGRTLDHQYLNEIEGLENSTAEVLAVWIWQRLRDQLPGLAEIVVSETENSRVHYRGE